MQNTTSFKRLDTDAPADKGSLGFWLVVLYLVLEYGRPQEYIPGLVSLRLPAVVSIFIAISLIPFLSSCLNDKQTKLFMMMLAFMLFHIPLAVNNRQAFETAKMMAIYFTVYLAIFTFVDSPQKLRKLINIFISIHLFMAIDAIVRRGGRGSGGWLGDQNDFALAINMIIPFAFFISLSDRKRSIPYTIFLLIFLCANMATFSRGGFVGLVAVGIYCWLKAPGTKKILSTALVSIMIIFVLFYGSEEYKKRILSIQEETQGGGTGEERTYAWKIGWQMFLDNPILGVGQSNYPWRFREYEIASGYDEGLYGRSRAGRVAHSLYFTLIPELGLVGIFLFLGMLKSIYSDLKFIRLSIRKEVSQEQQPEANFILYLSYAMTGSLIGFFVSGAFVAVLYYPCLWISMGIIKALRKIAGTFDAEHSAPSMDGFSMSALRSNGGKVGRTATKMTARHAQGRRR